MVKKWVYTRFCIDLSDRTSVFLAGSARSGTTWVEELINHQRDHRSVFEPFRADQVPFCRHFLHRQYLRPDDTSAAYLEPVRTILQGRFRNLWTDQYHQRLLFRRRMVKAVRANLLLYWLHCQFPEVPIVFLMRHPCATVLSQASFKNVYVDQTIEDLFAQEALVEDYLEPFRELVAKCSSKFDRLALLWCIENYIPLKQFKPDSILLLFYEELLDNPENQIGRIFDFLGRPISPEIYEVFGSPSKLARNNSAIKSAKDPISTWKDRAEAHQVDRVIELLGYFGLDKIYSREPMPDSAAAHRMLADNKEK